MADEGKPIVLEMADNMKKISTGLSAMLKMGLTEDMVVLLVQQKTKVSRTEIRKVFDGLRSLNEDLQKNREQLEGDE